MEKSIAVPEQVPAKQIFTDEEVANLAKFFDVLKRIHTRLAIEGYAITPDGIKAPTTQSEDKKKVPSPAPINQRSLNYNRYDYRNYRARI